MNLMSFIKSQNFARDLLILGIGIAIGLSLAFRKPALNRVEPTSYLESLSPSSELVSGSRGSAFESAQQLAIRRTDELRNAGVLSKQSGGDLELIGIDGKVAEALLDHLGVSRDQKDRIQRAVDELWEKSSRDLTSRVIFDEKGSSADGSVTAFRIPSDPDASEIALHEFQLNLAPAFGNKIAKRLLEGLDRPLYLGHFGRHDIEVTFSTVVYEDGREVRKVDYTSTDPKTGIQVVKSSFKEEDFLYTYLGTVFNELEER